MWSCCAAEPILSPQSCTSQSLLADPNDDPVVYTAVVGQADVLCALDRDFYAAEVVAFCQERGIEIMNDVELLRRLRGETRG